jgi:uncharacterized protein YcnI
VVLTAAPAAAHIEPIPSRVEPGDDAVVSFTVEHGCDESPTTKLTFKIPKGVKNATPEAKDGWSSKVKGKTIVFEDPASSELVENDEFSISFTAPNKTTLLVWKVVQKCAEGTIRWIDTSDGAENPPPRVGVGKDAPEEHEEEAIEDG